MIFAQPMTLPSFSKAITKLRHPVAEWSLWLGVPLVLYLSGLHTDVLAGAQRVLLATGLLRPETHAAATAPVPADYNLTLRSLDGKQTSLRDLKGKVIFLNLWASWCPPCIAEMPGIAQLYRQTDTSRVAFVMLSLDENPDKARRLMKRKGFTFPAYFPGSTMPAVYATRSIPTTFVISKRGEIVVRHEGMADYGSAEFKAFLSKLADQ
jgi:thiol-disulfide isomerase/thioredoxin